MQQAIDHELIAISDLRTPVTPHLRQARSCVRNRDYVFLRMVTVRELRAAIP